MSYIKRAVLDNFGSYLKPNKVLILLGARRVGKTQLIKKYIESSNEKVLQLNGEDLNNARLLEERTLENSQFVRVANNDRDLNRVLSARCNFRPASE